MCEFRYAVVPKTKKTTKKIIAFIKRKHSDASGIIYCLSKKECEVMASELKGAKINACYYHAALSPERREKVQRFAGCLLCTLAHAHMLMNDLSVDMISKWMEGKFHVMVATIAFGLGIDKPDVRFVIHHSLPRTVEEYYQESGRAGRDGQNGTITSLSLSITASPHTSAHTRADMIARIPADCVVFYRHSDRARHMFMQLSSCRNAFQARTKQEKMKQLTAWCEDNSRCRRHLLLEYFGEAFTGSCNGMCDNCLYGLKAETRDLTVQSQAVLRIATALAEKATMANVVSVLRGCATSTVKKMEWSKLPDFGAGAFTLTPITVVRARNGPRL
jgi:bloom syndrome protein